MCGRFSLAVSSADELLAFFRMRLPGSWHEEPELDEAQDLDSLAGDIVPRFNVAPSQQVPVARAAPGADGPKLRLEMQHWGLVPGWSKGEWAEVRKQSYRMINARAETAFDKPSFKKPIARSRGLVATTGFYEWDRSTARPHPATLFHRPGRALFALAAICERWRGPEGVVDSFCLLTTQANAVVGAIHDRMPVVVPEDAWTLWLDPGVTERALIEPLLGPAPDELLQATVVGTTVNDARSDSEACWTPA